MGYDREVDQARAEEERALDRMDTHIAIGRVPPPIQLPDKLEQALVEGDLSKLSVPERVRFYKATCESLGVNPLTKPFGYIVLNGKLTLYALKACTDQLRERHGVSIGQLRKEERDGLYIIFAPATDKTGRTDEDMGAVPIANLKGEALCNAMMKCATKAKRRVTLSICGLGWLDETEVTTIPGARIVDETTDVRPTIATPRRLGAPTRTHVEPPKEEDQDDGARTTGAVERGGDRGRAGGGGAGPARGGAGAGPAPAAPSCEPGQDDLFDDSADPAAEMRARDAGRPAVEAPLPGCISQAKIAVLMATCRSFKVTDEHLKEYLGRTYGIEWKKQIRTEDFDAVIRWVGQQGPTAPRSHARVVCRRGDR